MKIYTHHGHEIKESVHVKCQYSTLICKFNAILIKILADFLKILCNEQIK